MIFVECLACSILCFHVHRHAGLKFHSEFVLVDGDLFNQPPDKLLVVFGNGGGLLLEKCAHIGNPFTQLIPACIFHQSLLLLFTQVVYLLGYVFVVRLGAGQLQKLRLQFFQSVIDIGQGLVIFLAEDGGDVILQSGEESILPA
mgnify:CR=1 FL=1